MNTQSLPTPNPGRLHLAVFAVFVTLVFWIQFPLLRALWAYSDRHVHFSHFVLIGPVVVYLLYTERHRIFARLGWSSAGLVLVLAGVGLSAAHGQLDQGLSESGSLALRTFALLLTIAGGFITCFGWTSAGQARFPLGFMACAIPFPESVLNSVVRVLQLSSTEVVAVVFKLTPTPVLRQGTVFELPGMAINVAPECSGIRSSIALVITAILAGHFFLRSPWRKIVLVLAVIPIAIFKNGLRIVTLTLLSFYVDPGFIKGSLHTQGGYPFFALSLLLALPVLLWLRAGEKRRGGGPGKGYSSASDRDVSVAAAK